MLPGMSDDFFVPPEGASVWERDLFAHLTNHVEHEGKLLSEYVHLAETTDSKALAYVIRLLLDDERRHHSQFAELAASLKSEAELRAADPVIPRLDFDRADRDVALEVTRRLLANEEADAVELKRLRKDLRDVEDTTLWALLVETMQRDTEKHMAVLRFVEDHTKNNRR